MSGHATRAITSSMSTLPSEKVQPKIRSGREADALDAIVAHIDPATDAEAVRAAVRWMARLIDMVEEGAELTVCDDDGRVILECPITTATYQPDEGDALAERRWTVKLTQGDRANLAEVRAWLTGCSTWWDALSTAIVRIGEIVSHLEQGCELWATSEGHSHKMVIL